jgi:hypothetical protein
MTSRYDEPIEMDDRKDAIAPGAEMQEALLEPVATPAFPVKKYDLAATMPGGGVVLVFEIVSLPTMTAIYPYTTKHVIAPRDA